MRSRRVMTALLEKYIREKIRVMGLADLDLKITYKSLHEQEGESLEECFERHLHASEKRENIFKTTAVGPHRDTLVFLNFGKDMRDFASQGQIRMTVMATKLAIAEYLHEERGTHPVFLFDDILLEIDPVNTESILASFGERNQMFFTSTTLPEFDFFTRLPEKCVFTLS
jgi:DNA replication and repair protein RecF